MMTPQKELQIWRVVKQEAGRLSTASRDTSLDYGDLVGYGWERILKRLASGQQNCEAYLHVWARDGMLRAIENDRRQTKF